MSNLVGATAPRTPGLGAVTAYLIGMGGLAFTITILWLSMRAVMGIGGACASGGPYVPAVECPDAVELLTPLSIFGLFIFGGLAAWGGANLGGRWIGLIALGWPALFLSLGWNFLEFGFAPPSGSDGDLVWSWIFCGVVFVLMGGIPLIVGLRGAAMVAGSHRAYAGGRVLVGPKQGFDAMRDLQEQLQQAVEQRNAERADAARAEAGAAYAQEQDRDVAARLERLARLHAAGDLTDAEFDAAKRATLAGASR
ncbi:MAG TPA: SHOCT domain-containing protein [Candidatus Limnocylindrales bacterium]|nr:SHOCT domain-containing protein [Candidatus Limnocylindrales bacterium]